MKKILFLLFSCVAVLAHAQHPELLHQKIDSLIAVHPLMEQASLGIQVYDLTADSLLYQMDEKKLHRPASTTKTFTAAAALKNLGPDYPIKTSIYGTGKIKKHRVKGEKRHVWEGNLFLKGNFDPAFSQADLDTLLLSLQKQEIDSISGNIYTDLSMKNRTLKGYGWCWDDEGDDAPLLSPLVIDKDTCFVTKMLAGMDSLGIHIGGCVLDSICPATEDLQLLAEKKRTLHEILPHCLKTSDNRYAESILYQLGNMNNLNYDPTDSVLCYVNQLIESFGFPGREYNFVDGSGLSFYNNVTPEIEVALMKYIYQSTNFFDEFVNALPISGVDGTLSNRMKGTVAEGIVHAKTGSLTGTYALAGYLFRPDGHILAFSMMNDGVPNGQGNGIRGLQDQILIELATDY